MKKYPFIILCLFASTLAFSQNGYNIDPFKQLHELLPTPNAYRTASGAPGHQYWQQKVDYKIKVQLDEKKRKIMGSEQITYHNNSPDVLEYLWVQLDQNNLKPDAEQLTTKALPPNAKVDKKISFRHLDYIQGHPFEGGYNITKVSDINDKALQHVINKTMMRVDLPQPLKPGEQFIFNIDWNYLIEVGV